MTLLVAGTRQADRPDAARCGQGRAEMIGSGLPQRPVDWSAVRFRVDEGHPTGARDLTGRPRAVARDPCECCGLSLMGIERKQPGGHQIFQSAPAGGLSNGTGEHWTKVVTSILSDKELSIGIADPRLEARIEHPSTAAAAPGRKASRLGHLGGMGRPATCTRILGRRFATQTSCLDQEHRRRSS